MGSQISSPQFGDYLNNIEWRIEVNGTYRDIQYPICDFIESAYQQYLSNPNIYSILMIEDESYLDFKSMTLNESLRMQRILSH